MEKQRWEESEKGRAEERRSEKGKSQRKEDAGARKGNKVAKHCVFPMICGSGGSKSRLAKAAGAEPCGQMRDEKLHAVVARSTFRKSKRAKDHFWKLTCQKSARRCGAKHISKSKCTKHTKFGTFGSCDVEKVHAVCGAKQISKPTCTKHYTTPHSTSLHFHFTTPLHYTQLHYSTLQLQLRYTLIALHWITLHYTPLHYTTLNYTTLQLQLQLQLQPHYTNYTTLRSTPLHYTTLHCTQLHYTTTTTATATTLH